MVRKRHLPDKKRPNTTICGHTIRQGRYSLALGTKNKPATCQNCLERRGGGERYKNRKLRKNALWTFRNGNKIPYSTLDILESTRSWKPDINGPPGGPPYPWER